MFVAQAAHEATTGTTDLRRVERQLLILCHAEVHRAQIRQPRGRAILPPATTDAVQPLRFVTHTDLFQFDARLECGSEVAHERTKIDTLFGREIQCELAPVPLPLGIGELHLQTECAHLRHGVAARAFVVANQGLRATDVVGLGNTHHPARRFADRSAVCNAGVTLLSQLSDGVNLSQIFAAIAFNDDVRRRSGRRNYILPLEELFAVALEGDLDQVRHSSSSVSR